MRGLPFPLFFRYWLCCVLCLSIARRTSSQLSGYVLSFFFSDEATPLCRFDCASIFSCSFAACMEKRHGWLTWLLCCFVTRLSCHPFQHPLHASTVAAPVLFSNLGFKSCFSFYFPARAPSLLFHSPFPTFLDDSARKASTPHNSIERTRHFFKWLVSGITATDKHNCTYSCILEAVLHRGSRHTLDRAHEYVVP